MSVESSRRDFLKNAALGAGSVAAMGVLKASDAAAAEQPPVTQELPIPEIYEADRPEKTEYDVDVLVIGGGYAGLNAAYVAKHAGMEILLVDKGRPGFSGQSPWPTLHHFFDDSMGDNRDLYREMVRYGSEYIGNQNWIEVWMNESKETYERVKSWGLLEQYPLFFETPYWKTQDVIGYRRNVVGDKERRPKCVEMLNRNKIPFIQHTMITHVIVENDRVAGAMGFQVTTGAIITVHAKAVIMCTGGGAIHSNGHCVGGDTFDGEIIAYNLGLPIAGKEYEDFHGTSSFGPVNLWFTGDVSYMDPIGLSGGFYTEDSVTEQKERCEITRKTDMNAGGLPYVDRHVLPDELEPIQVQSLVYGKNPKEVRRGKQYSPRIRVKTPGAAIGMCTHLSSGVFCGLDDVDGCTGIPGLYVAGDGTLASHPGGGSYSMGGGFTSNFVSLNGARAARAAAAYCNTAQPEKISKEKAARAREEIEQPLKLEKGHNPNWARDVLMGIMAPYWVSQSKTEASLETALYNVEYMRDHVAPRLLARNTHDLRLCHEMKHKILSSELKLRASLARKESRGFHYREDYPERNDDKYKAYITLRKDNDGKVKTGLVPVKKEWTEAGIRDDK